MTKPTFILTTQHIPSVLMYLAKYENGVTSIYAKRIYNKLLELIPLFIDDVIGDDIEKAISETADAIAFSKTAFGLSECIEMIRNALTVLSTPIAAADCVDARKIVGLLTNERINIDVYRSDIWC